MITLVSEVAWQLFASVTTRVYTPLVDMVTPAKKGTEDVELKPSGPVHWQLAASPALSCSVWVSQTGPVLAATSGGSGITVMDLVVTPLQLPMLALSVYTPVLARGTILIIWV